jgi:uncharacterized membrane protein HdeD (DUF308 family)
MLELLSRYWWTFVLRGVFAIIFGVMAWVWPGITLAVLVIFFGAYAFVDGILLVINALGGWRSEQHHWLLLLEGLVGVGIGIITFINPAVTAIALLFYIAVWSIATGVLEISSAIQLRKEVRGEGWMILSGIASILFGVLLMIFPGAGALGLTWLIAAYAIVFGVMLIGLGLKLRSRRSQKQPSKA